MTAAAFRHRYATAFAMFLEERSEISLRAAYELGREAVKADLSVLEIAGAHHDSLASALVDAPRADVAEIATAAGDFLVESLAAYEMVQRGSSEARRTAFLERKNARMLRQLSTLLADESLAAGERDSLEEILQLVAEHARELTDARSGWIHVGGSGAGIAGIDARSESDGADTWSEVFHGDESASDVPSEPGRAGYRELRSPLLSLDGSILGWLEVEGKNRGEFTPGDEAIVTHIAQMTAAAIERTIAYT